MSGISHPPIPYMDTTLDWIEGGNQFAEQGSDLGAIVGSIGTQVKEAAVTAGVPSTYSGGFVSSVGSTVKKKATSSGLYKPGLTETMGAAAQTAAQRAIAGAGAGAAPSGGGGTFTPSAAAQPGLMDRMMDSPLVLALGIYLALKYL